LKRILYISIALLLILFFAWRTVTIAIALEPETHEMLLWQVGVFALLVPLLYFGFGWLQSKNRER